MNSKKLVSVLLTLVMLVSISAFAAAEGMTAGTYTQTVNAMHGEMTLEVTVTADKIESVKVTDHVETPGVGTVAVEQVPASIVENQSLAVDVVTGVTISSRAILSGVEKCLEQAGADIEALKKPLEKAPAQDVELTADVVVVGGGGAGLAAAVAATDNGASVILVEKAGFLGGNSIVSGGIYNTPDAERQLSSNVNGKLGNLIEAAISEEPVNEEHKALMETVRAEYEEFKTSGLPLYDSPNWFALQTWNGGDKIGDLNMVKKLTAEAYPSLEWLESMGMKFRDGVVQGAGSLYPRTHNAELPNGVGYIKAFTDTLAKSDAYTQLMNTVGKELIMDGDKVVGVIAEAQDGSKVTLHANKGVVLATGGFAGNVELRQKYCEGEKWPDLGKDLITSNMPAVTGDGIFMAEKAGARLVNMDQIQLLHVCNPWTGATYDVMNKSLMNGVFVNKEGERFVREDGRRDVISKAIIAQTDGVMYAVFSADAVTPDTVSAGGMTLKYYLDNHVAGYVSGDSLEQLAEKLDMPADALVKSVEEYNSYVDEAETDPFGRVSFGKKLLTAPYYAYPRAPAAHHTMGGVKIDEECHALNAEGNPVPGLYCAGEITGNIHGGNRLGGNAIVDFCVFGRIAGTSAAEGK